MSKMERFPDRLKNRTVLLIAGTGGIGLAIASALLSRGAKVILTSTRQQKLDERISSLRQTYPEIPAAHVSGYVLDLGGPQIESNIQNMFKQIRADGIEVLNHLVYLAGDPLPTIALDDVTLDAWQKANQVRCAGALLTVKHAQQLLRASPEPASITLTSGSIAHKPIAGGWSMLSMIAAGLVALARQLAFDLKPHIRVNSVSPGLVDTELWGGMSEEDRAAFYKTHAQTVPTARIATAEDVAEAYLYLMSDGNVTGVDIGTDSGIRLV